MGALTNALSITVTQLFGHLVWRGRNASGASRADRELERVCTNQVSLRHQRHLLTSAPTNALPINVLQALYGHLAGRGHSASGLLRAGRKRKPVCTNQVTVRHTAHQLTSTLMYVHPITILYQAI